MQVGFWNYVDELATVPSMVKMLEAVGIDVIHTDHIKHNFPVLICVRPGMALFLELFATKGYAGYRKYCKFEGHGMFEIFPEFEELLTHDNVHIVIDYSYEYMYLKRDVDNYFAECKYNDRIHLLLGSAEVETNTIQSYFVPSWCMTEVETVSYGITELEDKTYLCLNRQPRAHRVLLLAMLNKYNAIDEGHISFVHNKYYLDINDYYATATSSGSFIKMYLGKDAADEALHEITDAFNGKDQILDKYDYDDPHYSSCFYTNIYEQYKHSMFSLISEASSDMEFPKQRFPYISEKTFKAIAYGHPFMLNTVHDTLKVARMLGFKTFEPFINESYDNEPDTYKRVTMIAKEVRRLTTVNKLNFNYNISSIVEHNKQQFKNKKDILLRSGFSMFLESLNCKPEFFHQSKHT